MSSHRANSIGLNNRDDLICRIISAVSTEVGTPPTELTPPLADSVDPDALNSLVKHGPDDLRIVFTYQRKEIEITGDGAVTVKPSEA